MLRENQMRGWGEKENLSKCDSDKRQGRAMLHEDQEHMKSRQMLPNEVVTIEK